MAAPSEPPLAPRPALAATHFPSLSATATSTNLLILSLAVLLSSGVLLRQFHPKYKPRPAAHNALKPKKSKEKDEVLKSIILAQAVAVSESATKSNHERGRKTPSRSRAGSSTLAPDDPRHPLASTSACIASTSAAIVQGLSRLSAPGSSNLDSNSDNTRARSRSASGAVTPAIIIEEEESAAGTSKKKKDAKKGKGAVSTQSTSTSTGTSTSLSPAVPRVPVPRRKPTRDASTMCEILPRVDVGVQTERTAEIDTGNDWVSAKGKEVDKSEHSTAGDDRNSTPPLATISLPSTDHYDLHSSFQSTPPRLSRSRSSSPPLSPTPISPPKESFLDRPTSPPILLNGSKASVLPIPNSSGSANSRRKSNRKASLTPGSPSSKFVVGMPKPVAKDEDSDRLLSPSIDRRQPYSDKTTKSPESISLNLPRRPSAAPTSTSDKGKGRETISNGQDYPRLSTSASSGSLRSPESLPVHLPPLPNQGNARRIASSNGGPQSPNSPQYAQYHLSERQSFGAGAGMIEQGLRRSSTITKDDSYSLDQSNDSSSGWTADAMARMVGLGMGSDGRGGGRSEAGSVEAGRLRDGQSWSEAAGASRSRSVSGGAKSTDDSEGGRDPNLISPRQVPPFSGLFPFSSASTEPPSTPITQSFHHAPPSVASSQSRSESRQSSLSVPLSAQHFQQQIQLQQQQQAFAYAQGLAQAQYQHALALQYQAANGLVQGLNSAGSASPINGLGHSMNAQRQQQVNGWNSLPHSPLLQHQFSHSQLNSVSPTTPNFPAIHPYYVPGTPSGSNYYTSPPNGHYGRQSNSGKSNGKRSPANGTEKRNGSIVLESTGWKIKLRTAEMEADRSGKELEIARWRLVVLEEDRIANEIENQEALAALASRAQRAEARLKALEEVPRQADSSSNSGSGSPTTRPSSVTDLGESGPEALPSVVVARDNFSQSTGSKVHPLAWLDLDAITFSVQASNSRPTRFSSPMSQSRRSSVRPNRHFSGSNSNSHSNDSSGNNGKQRRMLNPRRRSTNSGIPTVEFEADEEEVVILLDSPIRKRPGGSAGPSRRSSYRIEEGDGTVAADIEEEDSSFNAPDQLEVDGIAEEQDGDGTHEHVDFIGSLPTFLEPFPTSFLSPSTRNRSLEREAASALVSLPSFIVDQASPAEDDSPQALQDLGGPISPPLLHHRMDGYFIKRPASA